MKDVHKFAVSATAVSAILVITANNYRKTIRDEKKKRAAAKAWETQSVELIRDTYTRTAKALLDPEIPVDETLIRWKQDREFTNIIVNGTRPF